MLSLYVKLPPLRKTAELFRDSDIGINTIFWPVSVSFEAFFVDLVVRKSRTLQLIIVTFFALPPAISKREER